MTYLYFKEVEDLAPLTSLTRPEHIDQRLSDAVALVANSPELDRLRAPNEQALQAEQSSLTAGNRPQIGAFAAGSTAWSDDNDSRDSLTLGVSVNWTWDGGGRSANRRSLMNQQFALRQQQDLITRQRMISVQDLAQAFASMEEQIQRQEHAITRLLNRMNSTPRLHFVLVSRP